MKLFHQLQGESAILSSKGVYKQVDLYERDNELFAKSGSGFIRILKDRKTSVPTSFWEEISVQTKPGDFGRLLLK